VPQVLDAPQEQTMQKQWTLTTNNGETLEGLSSDEAARALRAIMSGTAVTPGRSQDTLEHELEVTLAA
jgi:hypothetical protein